MDDSQERSTTGLPVRGAAAAAYLIGFVSGVFLLVVEKDSAYVRFHAAQSTVVFVAALVVNVLLAALPVMGGMLSRVFMPALVVLWIVLIFKALAGDRYKLPWVGDFAEDISR